METDIEVLESIVKVHNDFLKGCNNETINEKEIQAIENVLNRIKELEEQNKQLTDAYMIQKDLINADFLSDYVSKDKIRAKLEEVRNMKFEDSRHDFATIDFAVMKFKELLKEE